MSERETEVYVDLDGEPNRAGRLYMRIVRGRESASFSYHEQWLSHPRRFPLDPVYLPLGRGVFHTEAGQPMFSGLSDSAPNRWGRLLLARRARLSGSQRTLFEPDYLLGVHDATRHGALRFRAVTGGPFLTESEAPILPLLRLGELLFASDRVQRDPGDEAALQLLLAPGSSLGGARPKASVVDPDGRLFIAKFPAVNDEWAVTRWEHVACRLAAAAGIRVQETRLEKAGGQAVLLARRFDRAGAVRLPFLSALAMIGARDRQEEHSYLELADAMRQHGARVGREAEELWRRMVFNVLITNTDDHLRNHGFLRAVDGWVLTPAYDLNPVPLDVRPRVHALALDDHDPRSSLGTLLEVADYFGVPPRRAAGIARAVADATSGWRDLARAQGLEPAAVERMATAFEHDDLDRALRLPRLARLPGAADS